MKRDIKQVALENGRLNIMVMNVWKIVDVEMNREKNWLQTSEREGFQIWS